MSSFRDVRNLTPYASNCLRMTSELFQNQKLNQTVVTDFFRKKITPKSYYFTDA